ncbi:hypothetical protein J5X84_43160 [Streptosporangiaceae bacterium NEAU-GS5]|nr:hypothetical protein [Streptosporangiaceae bacterium NEAU-GS5]
MMRRKIRAVIMTLTAVSISMLMISATGAPAQAVSIDRCNMHWGNEGGRYC